MRANPIRSIRRRHVVALLWLALVLPLAQLATSWHTLSHALAQRSGDPEDVQALHPTPCELCLSAAAVTGGALPGASQSPRVAVAHDETPSTAWAGVWPTWFAPAYRSRAPPPASH